MPKANYLDKTFHLIIEKFIATGQAPNHKEIADELGLTVPEGKKILRKLFSPLSFPGWLDPKTDNIASFAPFANSPNRHRVTIENEQKWYGQ